MRCKFGDEIDGGMGAAVHRSRSSSGLPPLLLPLPPCLSLYLPVSLSLALFLTLSPGLGFRVSGFGFQITRFELRSSGFGFRVSGIGIRDSGFGIPGGGGVRTSDKIEVPRNRVERHGQNLPGMGSEVEKQRESLNLNLVWVLCQDSSSVGSEGRKGRWGTPTMALHIRIQHITWKSKPGRITWSTLRLALPSGFAT